MSTSGINPLTSSLASSYGSQSATNSSQTNESLLNSVNSILNSASGTSGSGIDVTSTVNSILSLLRAPEQLMQQQETTLNTQASALKSIESDLESFRSAVNDLNDFTGAFNSLSVTSSNNNIVSATAANGTAIRNHTVVVNTLATTSSYYSAEVASSSATLDTGSFDIETGANQSVTIPVDSSDNTDTLDGLAQYINDQSSGVTASVVNDAAGARLALVSNTSGAPGDITVSNDTTGTNGNGMGFTKAVTGKNASLVVDGVPVASTSNTVTGVIPGVTLSLSSEAPSTTVTIGVHPDLNSAATAINNFLTGYNTLIQDINTQFNYNTSTNSAGALSGNTALQLVQQQLLSDISNSITGNNGIVNLESIGVSMQDDGTLSVNSTELNDALSNNFSAVQALFQSTSPQGITQKLSTDLLQLTDVTTGPLNVELNGINNSISDLNRQIQDFEGQLTVKQQQLTDQYSQINATLEELPSLLSQINSQLDSLNPKSS